MAILLDGVLTIEELLRKGDYPTKERLAKGPVAIAECTQEIPCNPCEQACKFGAIHVGQPITNCPRIDLEKCTGCGNCIAHCSGLAIFVLDQSYSSHAGTVSFPYEYPQLPPVGAIVDAVDREGKPVCKGEILKVRNPAMFDRTPVVTMEVPIEWVERVRGIALQYSDRQEEMLCRN